MFAALSNIRTVEEMVFRDEQHCRRCWKAWCGRMAGSVPPCGYKRSIALAGRDTGKRRARPGLYQCSNGDCLFQFTMTTHTPLHATKLPLRVWLKAMWLLLQSDKDLSLVPLAEALGVSQPTAWRMGHALWLMVARENMLDGRRRSTISTLVEGPERIPTTRLRAGAGRARRIRTKRQSWQWCGGRPTSCPALWPVTRRGRDRSLGASKRTRYRSANRIGSSFDERRVEGIYGHW